MDFWADASKSNPGAVILNILILMPAYMKLSQCFDILIYTNLYITAREINRSNLEAR
jgi:hypothetical protein